MNLKLLCCILCLSVVLTGCSAFPSLTGENGQAAETGADFVAVGKSLTIQNIDEDLILISNMDTLASSGLYYASWGMGEPEPYENSDGDTVDLYDAQLYLLLGEFSNGEKAADSMNQWLASERMNYEVVDEEEITCNTQVYSLLTYNCINEDNPYDRGVSAFGVCNNAAVCVELTCQKGFEGDLKDILTDFLSNCTYN